MRPFAFLLLLVWSTAGANDGSGSLGTGGTVRPATAPHPTIRLVEERIRIKLPEGRVRVEFTFRNEGPPTTVTMVFPENGYRANEMPGYRKGQVSQFGYFRTWVDGKPTHATLRRVESPTRDDEGYRNAWTKRVDFRTNQTRKVVNEYQGGMDFGPPWTSIRGFTYILETGGTWKGGRIGKTVAVIDARDLWKNSPIELAPDGWKGWKGYYTWERTDFKPTDNLEAQWFSGFSQIYVNGVPFVKILDLHQGGGDSKVMPVRKGKEVFVPIVMAAKALGANLSHHPLRLETHLKKVEIAEIKEAYIDQGRTMVPIRFVANRLGGRFAWYEDGLRIIMPPKDAEPWK